MENPKGVKILTRHLKFHYRTNSQVITELGIFKPETLVLEIQKLSVLIQMAITKRHKVFGNTRSNGPKAKCIRANIAAIIVKTAELGKTQTIGIKKQTAER